MRAAAAGAGRAVMGALALATVLLAAALVTGVITAVATSGVSMNPVYYQGDLVVVAHRDSYRIGQIVAYRAQGVDALVLHRIIGADGAGFVMKGDNNTSVDPFRPTVADVVGTAVVHVPGGGHVLHFLTQPIVLICAAALVLLLGDTVRRGRRSARRRRRSSMPDAADTARGRAAGSVSSWPRPVQTAWAATSVVLLIAVVLTVLSFGAPTTMAGPPLTVNRSAVVGYTATVPQSAAYDGTLVHDPDPVYRRLADTVTLTVAYTGPPGTMTVEAELAAVNGWHTQLAPLAVETVAGDGAVVDAPLDLGALQSRSDAAAEAIGIPAGILTLTLAPTVTSPDGSTFRAPTHFALGPLLFAPVEGQSLTSTDDRRGAGTLVPHTLGFGVVRLPVTTVRWVALLLLLVGALGAVFALRTARRSTPLDAAELIHRRHGAVLAEVLPMPTPTDRHIVDVSDFATMAKLARRVGLLVMHWSRSGVHTYLLIDDTTAYRYRHGGQDERTGEPAPAVDTPRPTAPTQA